MKKYDSFKSFGVVVALAAASLSMTSCDDGPHDPWLDEPHESWNDQYGWYDNYNHGDWGWNQDNWNSGQGGTQGESTSQLQEEAQTLVGTWQGSAKLSELSDDGQSRNNYEFDTKMTFYQTGTSSSSLSGKGYEIDAATDGSGDTQTLEFSWYIDTNGDIYIKYASGTTYVMDCGASQYGFHLGPETGYSYDTFFGYMIGTGTAKGDVMYIDLARVSTNNARRNSAASADSVGSKASSFGGASVRKVGIANTVKKLPKR